jgi:hypothetical protein
MISSCNAGMMGSDFGCPPLFHVNPALRGFDGFG